MAHSDSARTQDAEAGWFQVGAIQQHLDIISARQSKGQLDGLAGKVPAAKLTTWVQILGSWLRESTSCLLSTHVPQTCTCSIPSTGTQNANFKCKQIEKVKQKSHWIRSELCPENSFNILKKRCLACVILYLNTELHQQGWILEVSRYIPESRFPARASQLITVTSISVVLLCISHWSPCFTRTRAMPLISPSP